MLFNVSSSIGYPALAALVLGESAGLPLPGETALIVAGGLAAAGQLSLPMVIAVAAVSAIIGDMIGYWVGRRGGRKLLLREGRFSSHRRAAVAKADVYFQKYGVVTVFFARFVPGVRVVGAVAAGTTQMRFRAFAIANALGCITWASTVASIAYVAGPGGTLILIALGFSIAGIGIVSAWWKSRHGHDPLEAPAAVVITAPVTAAPVTAAPVTADPLGALGSALAQAIPATHPARAASADVLAEPALPRTGASPMTLAACGNRLP